MSLRVEPPDVVRAAEMSIGDEPQHGACEESRHRRGQGRLGKARRQTGHGRVTTAERAHVRDEEQQGEAEGGQHGRQENTGREPGGGAPRGLDLAGRLEDFEARERGGEAEEDGELGSGEGSHGRAVACGLWLLFLEFGS